MNATPDALRGLRILVVEDETLIAEELCDRLTRLGATVVGTADTADGAVRAADEHHPDLILMDVRLKGPTDGIAAAEAIRRAHPVPVVFLTAHSDRDTVDRAKGTDPFGYVVKPFNERDLALAVEMAVHRHGLERQLRESERRYAATLASIGDGVIATDVGGHVTFLNAVAEGLTRWSRADAQGRPVADVLRVLAEADRTPAENPALRALRLNRAVELDGPSVLMARDDEAIPIDDSAAPITDDRGRVLGAVVAFRDIRQRRLAEDALQKTEEQLRQAQKMEAVGRLAGGIAHDFNNLLTVINGFSEILLAGGGLDPTGRELVGEIKKAGERAAGLTRQLLAFSRKQIVQPVPVHLGNLVADISRLVGRLIGEDIVLTTTADADLWPVLIDPSQAEQVVMNLSANARDAMPRGGRLTIEAANAAWAGGQTPPRADAPPGRYVRLVVRDTGVGMDRTTQDRAFEPFFTTKGVGEGTGLGLATVYGIVKQAGGFALLDSEVGRGTTVTLYFPAEAGPVVGPGPADTPAPARGREVILLVEDDDAVRTLVATALRREGYTVHAAKRGDEAVAVFAEHAAAIRLVVADVVLPGLSGREVVERVRATHPAVRCLFLSGYADAVARHGLPEAGAAFLEKPFTLAALTRKVRAVLDG